jgi:hypothetical protein
MRVQAAVILLLAATCAADAQCAIGSFPTTNGDGRTVCQSAGGQTPPSSGFSPGGIVTCPRGTTAGVDQWGNRTCSSLAEQQPLPADVEAKPAPKPKPKKFEISKKCPECK